VALKPNPAFFLQDRHTTAEAVACTFLCVGRRDVYVLAPNLPGLMLAIFMTVTCYGFADDKVCADPMRQRGAAPCCAGL
jgi:hypothetical protein